MLKNKQTIYVLIAIFIVISTPTIQGEVVFDGSMNPDTAGVTLTGSYKINESDGRISGNNLFHSFLEFNINLGESAIFTGTSKNIKNIVTRVTGHNKSLINGTLDTSYYQANFFLLNPSGIEFGPKAHLNINGSFHALTSDYLKMKDGIQFDGSSNEPTLSISDPYAFGFLEKPSGYISLKGSNLPLELEVENGKTISLISSDILIEKSFVMAPEGQIVIASVKNACEVIPTENGFENSEYIEYGPINIKNGSDINVSGDGSGHIFMLGGETTFSNSDITASNEGNKNGGKTLIDVDSLTFDNDSKILSDNISYINTIPTHATYSGGSVSIFAKGDVIFTNNSMIETSAVAFGNSNPNCQAGSVEIHASSIIFSENSYINSRSEHAGKSGNISLFADNDATFIKSMVLSDTDSGDGSTILIDADNISFIDGAGLGSHTVGYGKDGGDIILNARKSVSLLGTDGTKEHYSSSITSYTKSPVGKAGDITINSNSLLLRDGGKIIASTSNAASGGTIHIINNHDITITGVNPYGPTIIGYKSGIFSSSDSTGNAGSIIIETKDLTIDKQATISSSSNGSGNAGSIKIDTRRQLFMVDSTISSESKAENNGGAAGTINVSSDNSIYLLENSALTTEAINSAKCVGTACEHNGEINTQVKNLMYLLDSKITTSVVSGEDNAGNINTNVTNLIMNSSQIIANAYEGKGGNIYIAAEKFIQSKDSLVDASSNKGIDGQITIDSPDLNVGNDLASMPDNLLDVSKWMKNPCDERSNEKISRLIVKGMEAAPTAIDDLWPAPPVHNTRFLNKHNSRTEQNNLKPSDALDQVEALFIEANKLNTLGNYNDAAQIIENIVSLPQISNAIDLYVSSLIYLTKTLCSLGYHRKALTKCEKALPFIQKCNNTYQNALFYSCLSDLYLSLRKNKKAKDCIDIALKASQSLNQPVVLANVLNNYGNLLTVEKRFNGAIKQYNKSLSLINDVPDTTLLKSIILLNLVFVLHKKGVYNEIIPTLEKTLTQVQQLEACHDKAAILIALCIKIREIQSMDDTPRKYLTQTAIQLLENALWIGEDLKDNRIISQASGYLGKIYEDERDFVQAFDYTRRAIFAVQQGNFNEILYLWQWQLGRLFNKTGDLNNASLSFQNAIDTLNPIRQQLFLGIRGYENSFETKIRPIYLDMASLIFDQVENETNSNARDNKLKQARDTMETLKQAEIQDYFNDECLTSYPTNSNSLDTIPSKTAVIYPIQFLNHLTILISFSDGIKQFNITIGSKQLDETVRDFRFQLENWDEVNDWKETWYGRLNEGLESSELVNTAKKLYDWIIEPIEPELIAHEIDTLLIVPEGSLRLIPFSAFYDGTFFLVEKYAFVTIPAINLTDTLWMKQQEKKALLCGLSKARHGFLPLIGVKKEIESIHSIINGEMLVDENYTLEKLTKKLKQSKYSIVHLATHGVFGGTQNLTYVLTYDQKLTMNQLEKLIGLTKLNQNNIDLLVLSACQTAQGNERAAFGLAGIALKAGARSAIATLWTVNDEAAYRILIHFYDQIRFSSQITKAKALQSAMKQMVIDTQYCHPSYWAPFLLIGNWY